MIRRLMKAFQPGKHVNSVTSDANASYQANHDVTKLLCKFDSKVVMGASPAGTLFTFASKPLPV
jgi:hypothetical protein